MYKAMKIEKKKQRVKGRAITLKYEYKKILNDKAGGGNLYLYVYA